MMIDVDVPIISQPTHHHSTSFSPTSRVHYLPFRSSPWLNLGRLELLLIMLPTTQRHLRDNVPIHVISNPSSMSYWSSSADSNVWSSNMIARESHVRVSNTGVVVKHGQDARAASMTVGPRRSFWAWPDAISSTCLQSVDKSQLFADGEQLIPRKDLDQERERMYSVQCTPYVYVHSHQVQSYQGDGHAIRVSSTKAGIHSAE